MDDIIINKYWLYFTIYFVIFVLAIVGIMYYNNYINMNMLKSITNRKINKGNNRYIFDELNHDTDNNNYIIDRSNDNEFYNIVKKTKSQIKPKYNNVVLITSKIIVSNNAFSYTNTRSIYSTEQRLSQTKNTIRTIREQIPNACIFLIDNSEFENRYEYIGEELNELCDVFINPINNVELNYYTNINKYKSIAEAYQIIYFLDLFNKLDITYDKFFKISGRYYINNTFNYSNYITDKIIFANDKNLDFMYCYTSFYMIPSTKFNIYFNAYKVIYNNRHNEKLVEQNIEYILPMLLKVKNIKIVTNLGITQIIAVTNEISNI